MTEHPVYRALLARLGEAAPQPRLHPTRRALELLGSPHRAIPLIHITGTNGKTSTSRIAAAVLRAHGRRVGLFTSPHLVRFNERISIDGAPITDEQLQTVWPEVQDALAAVDAELASTGDVPVTFFEALTVLGYTAFERTGMTAAVIEVGMGGLWDSTNVADGRVAVFTPISLDHTARLGLTVAEIATTKSGIIKPGATVVVAEQTEEAGHPLADRARRAGADTLWLGRDFGFEVRGRREVGQTITAWGPFGVLDGLDVPLTGRHQAMNTTVALAAVDAFLAHEVSGPAARSTGSGSPSTAGFSPDQGSPPPTGFSAEAARRGVAAATSPGRLERVGADPLVLVDAAHNPGGAAALAAALRDLPDASRFGVVLAVLADKDARGIVEALAPVTARFFVTTSNSDRSRTPADLLAVVREVAPAHESSAYDDQAEALDAARGWAAGIPSAGVVVTGSITLIGEAAARAVVSQA
ncbi:bifunctional folylpolyglutamate synthase/dihydrofolate synthase [Subtercola sp. YIM 133946]|uniref:bifunctional folylpolyglutamate synthase/dihydrofolate synthase n=1 Tax=Subtercola sp. YIM 133946 TaxID=3118909 RepID=UPI002F91F90E